MATQHETLAWRRGVTEPHQRLLALSYLLSTAYRKGKDYGYADPIQINYSTPNHSLLGLALSKNRQPLLANYRVLEESCVP